MARKPDEWMPLHIGAYLKDTTRLTRDQHGAYFLLLLAYWCDGGPLVADDGALGAIVKATPAEWRKLRPVMLRFFQERDGHWHQKRADEELAKARRLVAAKAEAGKKGAQTRWHDNDRTNGKPDGTAMAQPSVCQRQNDAPLPSPSPLPKEDTSSLRSDVVASPPARETATILALPACLDRRPNPVTKPVGDFAEWYAAYPRHVGKGTAEKAYLKALTRASPEALLDGARRYAIERQGDDPQFTKHPATWLNADCWLDDPKPEGTQKNGRHGRPTAHDKFFNAAADYINELDGAEETGAGQGEANGGDFVEVGSSLPPPGLLGSPSKIAH